MKKLLSFILTLSLSLSLITLTACDEEITYADATKDAVYTHEDVIEEVANAYLRQGLQQNYNQTLSRRNINPSPEEATSQHMIFLDCSSFVNAVYYEAFGSNVMPYDTNERRPQTGVYLEYARENKQAVDVIACVEVKDYANDPTGLDAIVADARSRLKKGDIVNYRKGNSGHSVLYLGGDTIIHSIGSDFYNNNPPETSHEGNLHKELDGTVQLASVSEYFERGGSTRSLFDKDAFCIFRPTARGLTPTEETESRMLAKGLDGEKTSNIGVNTGIARGEEITYTVTVKNHRDVAYKSVEIKDVLDSNLTFVSGSDGVKVDGQTVTFNKQIKSGETISVSWTAKVKDTAVIGSNITSDKTTVQGVQQATILYSVSGYTINQLQTVANKAKEYSSQNKTFSNPIDMVESLYKDALNVTVFDYENLYLMLDDIIDVDNKDISQNAITKFVAPNLYGGRDIASLYTVNKDIVRLITTQNLSVGDVIIAESDDFVEGELYTDRVVYVYVGDNQLVSCTSNSNGKVKLVTMSDSQYEKEHVLVSIFAYDRYAVLRPSQVA